MNFFRISRRSPLCKQLYVWDILHTTSAEYSCQLAHPLEVVETTPICELFKLRLTGCPSPLRHTPSLPPPSWRSSPVRRRRAARRHVLSGSRLSTRIIDTFRNARKVSKAEELDFVGVRPLAAVSDRNDGSPNPMDVAVLPNPAMYNHSQVLAINKFVSPESFCETKPLTSRSAVFGARGRRCEGTLTNRAHAGWYIGGGRRRIEPVVMRGFGLRQ